MGEAPRGRSEQQCGWLKDKYGVSWQIIPTILEELMQDKDPEKAKRVTEAMLQIGQDRHRRLEEGVRGSMTEVKGIHLA